ncbi:MAG TPA: hypothetical protein IGR15_10145 [Synechococcus sp. M44_DOE_062]|nr:hypothetical protein [Synechococcus sp. M44_DOE_062]
MPPKTPCPDDATGWPRAGSRPAQRKGTAVRVSGTESCRVSGTESCRVSGTES